MTYLPKDNNKTKGLGIFSLSLLIVIFSSCSPKNKKKEKIEELLNQPSLQLELLSPVIPDSINDEKEKQIYAGLHFWDNLNFRDTVQSLNQDFMEQNFSNFILHLHLQPDEEAVMKAFETMLDKASVSLKVLDNLKYISKLYLADPNSPMRSEELWIPYLKVVISSDRYSTGAEKARLEFELVMASKNRPGQLITDFNLMTSNGFNTSLYKEIKSGHKSDTLLIFYDPDCDNCKEIIGFLKNLKPLNKRIDEGKIKVLAVYSGNEKKKWEHDLIDMPSTWNVAYESGEIEDKDLYDFRALPTIFLIDSDCRVIRKDMTVDNLIQIIS